jgi:hypothetical protein
MNSMRLNNQKNEIYGLILYYNKYKTINNDLIKYISEFCSCYNFKHRIYYDIRYCDIIEKINNSIKNRNKRINKNCTYIQPQPLLKFDSYKHQLLIRP